MLELLTLPLMLMGWAFLVIPWVALAPATLLLWGYRQSRCLSLLLTALLWFLYTGYELAMYYRLLCSGECNIRVDLLLIYPLLLVMSLTAAVRYGFWRRRQQKGA